MTLTKLIVTIVVIAIVLTAVTAGLLQLAVSGSLPKGFGLWDADAWSNRILTAVVLLVIGVVLALWYRAARPKVQ